MSDSLPDVTWVDTTDGIAKANEIALELHELAHEVRTEPSAARDHWARAQELAQKLRTFYERVGEP